VLTLRRFIVGLDASNHHSGSSQFPNILQAVWVQGVPRKSIRTIDTSKARIYAIAEPPWCAGQYCTGPRRFPVVIRIVGREVHSILLFLCTKGDVGHRIPCVSGVSGHMKSVPYGLWVEFETVVFGGIPESACICLHLWTFGIVKRVMEVLC